MAKKRRSNKKRAKKSVVFASVLSPASLAGRIRAKLGGLLLSPKLRKRRSKKRKHRR
jgi:hypothetical protein